MADDDPQFSTNAQPSLQQLADYIVDSLYDVKRLARLETAVKNALAEGQTVAAAVRTQVAVALAEVLGKFLSGVEQLVEPIAAPALAKLAGHLVGRDVSTADLRRAARAGDETTVGRAIADLAFEILKAPAGPIEPSPDAARRMLATLTQFVFNGWFEASAFELLVTLFPDMDNFEAVAELPHLLIEALGLSRLSRIALRPLAQHVVATPLDWYLSKQIRPTLLAPATAIREFMRGTWDWADVEEELARHGYSAERIDALRNEARKFISTADVALLDHRISGDAALAPRTDGGAGAGAAPVFRSGAFDARKYLGEMGYDDNDAGALLTAEGARRLDAQEKQLADACLAAVVSGDIDRPDYERRIRSIQMPRTDTDHYLRLGNLRRDLVFTPLSDGDAQAAVKKQLVTFAWYRGYLARRGFDPDGITIKELLLRAEIDTAASAAELHARQAAARDADHAAALAERQQRIADKARADALPAFAEVRRAYVRGLIPRARLAAAVADAHPGIDAGDAAALLADADQDQQTYAAQLAARDAALKADRDRALPLATLEQSVLRGVTAIDAFDRELERRGYTDANRRILVALLQGRVDDQAAAEKARQAADARARLKGVSLAEFMRAVRLGIRSREELAALLVQLDTPDVDRALILDLVAADQSRDAAAAAKRQAADAAAAAKAINLPLRRRAVIKGIRSREQYAQDLAAAGVSLDDRALELGLIDVELADAAAAHTRAKAITTERAAADRATPTPALSLEQLIHAVKLGILTPDALRQALTAAGYASADVELLVATVIADVPDVRAAQKIERQAAGALQRRGVDLADFQRAVARGIRTLDDYDAMLAARGFGEDDRALLRQLLAEKVAVDVDSLRAKVAAALAGVADAPTIAELETAITTGAVKDAAAQRYVQAAGVARDVALVYVRLVHTFAEPTP